MTPWLTWILLAASLVGLVACLVDFARKRPPGDLSSGAIALFVVAGIVQLAYSIIQAVGGARAAVSTAEFFAYLAAVLIIPVGALFWSLLERTRWSALVLAVTAFADAVMVARLSQLWHGAYEKGFLWS